jgi:transposase
MLMSDQQRRQAIELHASGMSYRKIARELGCKSDSTIRMLFIPKKPKPIPTTPRKMPAKQKSPVTKSVLVHRVRFSSTSVPMRPRYQHPLLNHIPTRDELYAMLREAVRNTRC